MNRTAKKTVVAKILTDDLTQSKHEAINHEYEAFQRYIRGDDDANLYSATKQCADTYVDTENLRDGHEYPWFIPIQPHDEIPDESDVKDSKIVRKDGSFYAHITVQ